ncbi:MAG: chorismate synthase [Treponema sp.]|nr:chorismate synthase [Treponema sp.]
MAGSSFGELFRITTFGESHGPACGCVVDGCPAGLRLDIEDIRKELGRRRPNPNSTVSTSRSEADEPEILSGVFEGKTLGTPIAILVRNTDQKSGDYENLRDLYRPGHADWTWEAKYGIRDHRGGGRSSGRETVGRVAAGAVAQVFLREYGIEINAWTSAAAGLVFSRPDEAGFDRDEIEKNPLRIPNRAQAEQALEKLEKIKLDGDSAGCVISCRVTGMPAGLGEPVFDKLDARMAAAIMSLGAVKGIEFGSGFAAAQSLGSLQNDSPVRGASAVISAVPGGAVPGGAVPGGAVPGDAVPGGSAAAAPGAQNGPAFAANRSGGILGGMSNSMPLEFSAAFKPIPSISKTQTTCDINGDLQELIIRGRHDVCLAGRAVPVVEAMAALVLADMILLNRAAKV